MQTRTKNGLVLAGAAVVLAGGLAWVERHRLGADGLDARAELFGARSHALDAVPAGALLVATADLDALRASPVGAPFLKQGREIPGLGKVKDVCGFDPVDTLHEVAVAIPAAGDSGEFGLVAAGEVDEEALLACAAKVIEARGGRAVVTTIGSFRSVHDATLATTGGEIAVRKGGPLLLGGGAYLRAMIDAADGRGATIRSSVAHTRLAREVGAASVRVTVVLTPEQRAGLAAELEGAGQPGSPVGTLVAGGVGVELGAIVTVKGVLACDAVAGCAALASTLKAQRDAQAGDVATRLVGFGAVLEKLSIEPEGELVHLAVTLPAADAAVLTERLLTLRGLRHPMPKDDPAAGSAAPGASVVPGPAGSGAPAPGASAGAVRPVPPAGEVLPADGGKGKHERKAPAGQ